MEIDFLNVGKGSCTVMSHPSGRLSIVDIDNSHIQDEDDVLTDPIKFINEKYYGKSIWRFILTHPDMDHMTGIDELFTTREIQHFWDTDNDKEIDTDSADFGPYNKEDWEMYQKIRQSTADPKTLRLLRDASSDCCWEQDHIRILSPSSDLIKLSKDTAEGNSDKYNHLSYVLRIQYNGIVTILGGDATISAWDDIYNYYKEQGQLNLLKAHVFLAPHHGSPNNVNKEVFKHIDPDYVVVSVLRGVDYDYSYYTTLAKKTMYSTKHNGNVKLSIPAQGQATILPEK